MKLVISLRWFQFCDMQLTLVDCESCGQTCRVLRIYVRVKGGAVLAVLAGTLGQVNSEYQNNIHRF